jgi:filamentous hemagglutinin family protein
MPNQLLLVVFLSLFSFSTFVSADMILDGTLGRSGPLQGPDFVIGAEFGQQHGRNLFHSFSRFNLRQGESATFSGPNSVNHIISRVTGGTVSTINGLLRSTIPKADFYFINPAGVMFGEQARLDVQGAFYASTAHSLRLSDGGQFNAVQPENSLLTVAPPEAFGFLEPNRQGFENIGGLVGNAPITVQRSKLTVPDTQTLSLIGGDITLSQGGLYAPAGYIHLASVASAGEVSVNPDTVHLDRFAKLGQIKLSQQSTLGNGVDKFDGAQRIDIRAGQFYLEDSFINAKVNSGEASKVVIYGRDLVELQQDAMIATESFSATDAGYITIDTDRLTMRHNANLRSDTQRGGAAGVITIQANHVRVVDDAKITSSTRNQGGLSGRIQITADTVQMSGTTQIKATSRGTAQSAGQVMIIADKLQLSDDATVDTSAFADANGDGGEIRIEANTLEMTDRAWLMSSSFNRGQSGPINIKADTLILSGQSAIVGTTFSQGKGGNVSLHVSDRLSITEAAVVTAGTEGQGSGGTVVLVLPAEQVTIAEAANITSVSEARNVVTEEIGRIFELTKQLGGNIDGSIFTGGGKSGHVYIKTDRLFLQSRASQRLAEELELKDCAELTAAQRNYFKSGRRKGLYDAFNDMIDAK